MKKVKFLPALIVFDVLALLCAVVSFATLGGAIAVLKEQNAGAPIAFLFIIVIFAFSIGGSGLLSIIGLPFAIISINKSEKKVFPIISLAIYIIFIVLSIVFIVIAVINGSSAPATNV